MNYKIGFFIMFFGFIVMVILTIYWYNNYRFFETEGTSIIYWDTVALSEYLAERQGFDIQIGGRGRVESYDGYLIKCVNGTNAICCYEANKSVIVKQVPKNCMIK